MKRLQLPFLLLAFALIGGGCVNREAQKQAERTTQVINDQTRPVTITEVAATDVNQTLAITGQLTTDSDTQVGAKVGGKLVMLSVRDGDRVQSGQLLAQIESTNPRLQVQQAQAGVAAARSQLNQAIANARIAPSRSQSGVEAARSQIRSARAQLQKAIAGARPQEKAQAEAAVTAAKSNLDTAAKSRERQLKLLTEGATSQAAYEQVDNGYQAALAQYLQAVEALSLAREAVRSEDIESAREAVRQAEEGLRTALANQRLDVTLNDQVAGARANLQSAMAQLSLAQQQLSDTRIIAPTSGTVYGSPAQIGTVVAPGTPVLRLIGNQGVYFEGDIPSTALEQVKVGSPVTVRIDGINESRIGTITSLSPIASNVGRLFKARIQIGGIEAKPGMFARGEVVVRKIAGARMVPIGAIQRRGGKEVVFVVQADKAKQVEIQRGLEQGDRVQVLGNVNPGDRVIVRGASDMADGTPVRVETAAKA